jgi:NAD(P)H-nitrite reductase large subunit
MLNAIYKKGWPLVVVEREAHVLPRLLDAHAAQIASDWLQQKGVALYCDTTVKEIRAHGEAKTVELENGTVLDADLVVMATGVKPNVELAEAAGIATAEGGILVNDHLQTNFPHIYAAGDVACGPVYYSDQVAIHAIQPTAVDHGRVAGANIAGQDVRYGGSLLMNILDVCGLQNVAYGNWLDQNAEEMVIANPQAHIYRKLMWHGDEITGAMFLGRANDVGMLTDVGMVKGIMQTRTRLGPWKEYLREHPFDIRRVYIATKVASKLAGTTLVGQPSKTRRYHYGGVMARPQAGPGHQVYVNTPRS